MPSLTDLMWPQTTVLDLLEDAEQRGDDVFDLAFMELNSGDDLLIAVVSGEDAAAANVLLEQLKDGDSPQVRLQEMAEGLIRWHQLRMKNIQDILDCPPDTEIRLGEGDAPIVLTGEKLKGFRVGLMIAQEWFAKFPLTITQSESQDEDE